MPNVIHPHVLTADDGVVPYRMTASRYLKMRAARVLPRGARVELLDGLIVAKTIHPATTFFGDLPLYPFTIRQYKKLMDAGVFPDDAKVELLGGVLTAQMPKYAPHNWTVGRLGGLIRALAARDWFIREEKAIEFGRDWRPEPDIVVARGPDDRYRANDPTAKDLVLVVEVSVSSYPGDRGVKWHGYAAAKIPVYWVVNLNKRRVEVYSRPSGRGKTARYRDSTHHGEGDSVAVVVDGRELGTITVAEILP